MLQETLDKKFLYAHRIRSSARSVIALITVLVGMSDMLSAIVPRLHWSMLLGAWPIVSADHRSHAQTFTVVVGFFLIMLSYGLMRGKRHAWGITLILLLLSAILHVQRSGSVLATVVALLLALVMCMLARSFQARSDPPAARRGYIALLLGLGVVTFYVIGGFLALYDQFAPLFDRFGIDTVIFNILTFTHMQHVPPMLHSPQALFFGRALPWLCSSAIIYGMVQLFRPVAAVFLPAHAEREKVENLVRFYGKSSISYCALSEDKAYFFSTSSKSVISYVLQGSTAVVAGDPIGPDGELKACIKQFVTFCGEQDWTIVFWQVRADIIDMYREAGLHLLKIGEDAVVNVQNFTLAGGAMENVRKSVRRAEKDGLQVVFYRGRVTNAEQLAQMEQISRSWLMSKGGSEMGFSQERFDPRGDSEQVYAVAVDETNKVHAFGSFIPIYGRQGWAFDQMRRAEQSSRGTGDLIFARAIEYLRSNGAEIVSMGIAPLSNANNENESFLASRIDSLTERFGNPAGNQSLFNFKKKFQPVWESRYLAYSDPLNLPKIGLALYRAHQNDSSLLSTLRKTLRDWRRHRLERCATAASRMETAKVS